MLCTRQQFWESEKTKMLCKKKTESFRNMKWRGEGRGEGQIGAIEQKVSRLWPKEREREGTDLGCGLGMHFAMWYAMPWLSLSTTSSVKCRPSWMGCCRLTFLEIQLNIQSYSEVGTGVRTEAAQRHAHFFFFGQRKSSGHIYVQSSLILLVSQGEELFISISPARTGSLHSQVVPICLSANTPCIQSL